MTARLVAYPAYKLSGVPWLGDVPAHWGVRRLRTVADMLVSNVDKHTKEAEYPVRLCNYVDVYKNDRITQAMPFMSATASRGRNREIQARAGRCPLYKGLRGLGRYWCSGSGDGSSR